LKAQMVKNAVIVPVGAKGGFFPKRPPIDQGREAVQADAVECYKTFIRALLDITDNRKGETIVPPADVVRRDGDDPYLVVAADKGTATFSDIANGIAVEHGFWLGDAFASGGSAGYDHKKMGITARGAWELVKRHFRELGRDIQTQDFTAVGIGDMSGDVFGNGMLQSRHTRLIAAFDHRHIFVDPDPDPAKSYEERQRLFNLPRSSWADYDANLISKGGGVFDRKAKSIKLSPEIRKVLGIEAETLTPNELIRAILMAEVDLLFNGGIGTYVKASTESHADVGDRANDAVRVDGRDLRAKVVGEGGNLGFTQRGRIEYALKGGRINTDAIDNSAGVDCSDHEVNIKILIDAVVDDGELTTKQRERLLAEMTDEVAELVLRDNYLQGQALSVAEAQGPRALPMLGRFMRSLERRGRLDRAVEFLPDNPTLARRQQEGHAMTRPELAVLLSYAKMALYDALLDSDLPEDPYFASDLARYFPRPLRKRFPDAIRRHRLRREIVATSVANSIINRAGITFVQEVQDEVEASAADIARAYVAAREIFGLRPLWNAVEALDNQVPASSQIAVLSAVATLLRKATLRLLARRDGRADIARSLETYGPGIADLRAHLDKVAASGVAEGMSVQSANLAAQGLPPDLARTVAAFPMLVAGLDVIDAAREAGQPVERAARIHFAIGANLGLDWLRQAAEASDTADPWQRLAASAAIDELETRHRSLTATVLRQADGLDPDAAVRSWLDHQGPGLDRLRQIVAEFKTSATVDAARLAIANRAVRSLGI
jgi:glutamate dehydrogenase